MRRYSGIRCGGSSVFHEPLYAKPHVWWCERATGLTRFPCSIWQPSRICIKQWLFINCYAYLQDLSITGDTLPPVKSIKRITHIGWDDLPAIESPFFACDTIKHARSAVMAFGVPHIEGLDETLKEYTHGLSPFSPQIRSGDAFNWLLDRVEEGEYVVIDTDSAASMNAVLRWSTEDYPKGYRVPLLSGKIADYIKGRWRANPDLPMRIRSQIDRCLEKARRSNSEPEHLWWNGLLERRIRGGGGDAPASNSPEISSAKKLTTKKDTLPATRNDAGTQAQAQDSKPETPSGVACSGCPGSEAVGSPVNPSLGAKVLANEIDFALPCAAMPLVWSRTYSSYVNAKQGGACGVLGYGWYLSSIDVRLDLQSGLTLLFDAMGRTITFLEPLLPGGKLYSQSEDSWLLRGGENAPWHKEATWQQIPPEWASDPNCVIAANSNKSLFWRFVQVSGRSGWHLAEQRDRLGNSRHYDWHSAKPDDPASPLLLREVDDGAGRRYRLHYLSLYPARPGTGPGYRKQAGWQADHGWRLIQIELLDETSEGLSLSEPAREIFVAAQAALKHPDISDVRGIVLVRYDYDKQTGDLIRVRDRTNSVTREFSTRNHLIVSHRHRDGPLHSYRYETFQPGAKVLEQYNEEGLSYRFTYFQEERGRSRTVIQDSIGRREVYFFEGEGGLKRMVRHQRADGSIILQKFDAVGRLTGMTDPLGRETKMHRDGVGRIIDLEDAAQRHTLSFYDEMGQLIASQDPAGRVTRYQYDSWGRHVGITYPDDTHETYQYPDPNQTHAANQPIRLIDARGGIKQLKWDSTGQLVSYTDCSNKTTQYRYNLWGSLLCETNALNQSIHYEHDQADKLIAVTLTDGGVFRYGYDEKDRLVWIDAPDGTRQHFAWDKNDLLTERIDAANRHRRYQYDIAGRLIGLENEKGVRSRFEYDVMDRLARETGFDHRIQSFHYDELGQLTEKVEESLPTRPATRYDYDNAGNLIARHLPANERIQPLTERFEWGVDGQLTVAYGSGGKVEFEYDMLGRLVAETQTQQFQDGHLWQWKHRQEVNELGVKRRSLYGDIPGIEWLTYGSGHLHGVELDDFGIDFERDDLHREMRCNVRTVHNKQIFFQDTGYNALGNISSHTLGIGGIEHERKLYRYDKLYRLIEINETINSKIIQYTYDKVGRLTGSRHGAHSFNYLFDATDNWAESTVGAPCYQTEADDTGHIWPDNRVTHLNGIKNTFDGAGNLIEQRRPDGTKLELNYDGAHRLATLTRTNPDGAQIKAWYAYDAFSRRVAKGVTEHGTEKITRYGWELNKLVHEATEEELTTIVYNPYSFAPIMRIGQNVKKSGRAQAMLATVGMELKEPHTEGLLNISFFITDHAGTPGKLISEEGQIIWEAEPDDWAAVRNERGVRQPIRYQGQWLDEESGFFYNRSRYYDPQQGRYITQDPVGLAGGLNLYAYVGGDPVSLVDPLGLNPCPPAGWRHCATACKAKGKIAKDCVQVTGPCSMLAPWILCDRWGCLCEDGAYKNPGHHERRNPTKSELPRNHEDLWEQSRPDPKKPETTRWTKEGSGKDAVYHRFSGDHNGDWHWSGSTAKGGPQTISPNHVPVEMMRLP